jgi:hypothetical protein
MIILLVLQSFYSLKYAIPSEYNQFYGLFFDIFVFEVNPSILLLDVDELQSNW